MPIYSANRRTIPEVRTEKCRWWPENATRQKQVKTPETFLSFLRFQLEQKRNMEG
jgi:hypothetical protein